jgi:ribokinase
MSLGEIIVIGSSNTDMVVKTDKLPFPGETKLGGTFFMNAGGKGANQAVAAARLGGNVTFITKVGKDIFGQQTLSNLEREGINIEFVSSDEKEPSGVALIMVNEEGENCIVVAPGSNAMLTPDDFKQTERIKEAEVILIQLEIPVSTVASVIRNAKASGQKVILNPAPAQKLDDSLLDGLFMITPNESEASFLTGIKVVDDKTASDAADILSRKGVQNVIITMGASGAFIKSGEIAKRVPVQSVKAVDTTGAGDVFNGALAVAILEGKDLEEAVAFSNRASAVSVTRMGAQSSIPYRKEMD